MKISKLRLKEIIKEELTAAKQKKLNKLKQNKKDIKKDIKDLEHQ